MSREQQSSHFSPLICFSSFLHYFSCPCLIYQFFPLNLCMSHLSLPSSVSTGESLFLLCGSLREGICRKDKGLVSFTPKCNPRWLREQCCCTELGIGVCWRADGYEGCPLYFLQECPASKWISEFRGQVYLMINHTFLFPPKTHERTFLPQQESAGTEEDLLCLAVPGAAVPSSSVQDGCWGQEYPCATDSVLHYSKPEKAISNGPALVKDIKVCVKLLNEVCS